METLLQWRRLPPFALDLLRLCVWLVLLLAIFVPLERLWARHRQKVFRQGFVTDLGYYFLNSLLPKLILIAPLSLLAKTVHTLAPSGQYAFIASLPLWLRFAAAIVVGDFGAYWGHRWMHEIPFLWRFHAVHHSAEAMDWLVNTRAHPLDVFFTRFCGLVPIYVLGLAQPTGNAVDPLPLAVAITGTIWSFVIHANLRWRFGWLERLVSTPAFHHWHHTKDPQHVDKNYAALLPCMDQCFGTFYLPRDRWPEVYGTEAPMARSMAGQLLQPFGREAEVEAAPGSQTPPYPQGT